jgi:carbon-monoxide dehydrogenase large subunit
VLEKAEDDIGFAAGRFTVKGTDCSVAPFDVAKAAADGKTVPQDLAVSLAASCDEMIKQLGFSYGARACESKSTRRRVVSIWCATRRSTTSGALSTR